MTDITTWIGIIGAGLILLSFVLNQTQTWKHDNRWYDGVNLIGAVLLIIYSWLLGSYPFLILNVVWAGVSLRDILSNKKRISFIKE